jgi:hypothetical protein
MSFEHDHELRCFYCEVPLAPRGCALKERLEER